VAESTEEEGLERRRVVLRRHDVTERERVGRVRKMVARNTKSGIWNLSL